MLPLNPKYFWLSAALCAVLLSSACGPGGDIEGENQKYLIYNLDRETGTYKLERVNIRTIRDVKSAQGDVVYLLGGGKLVASGEPGEDERWTEEQWVDAIKIEDHQKPRIEYTIDDQGTVIPWDFDSAMMLTVYHHIEKASEYFDSLPTEGIAELNNQKLSEKVGRIPCHYYPQVSVLGLPLPLFTDNAAYAFTMNAFIVPPRLFLDDAVPIYANRGVMTHEYSHAIFNRLVHQGARVPTYILDRWQTEHPRAFNELQGLDEGIADIFGALDTQDPNYIAPSIDETLVDRNLDKARYYETCLGFATSLSAYPPPELCGGNYPSAPSGENNPEPEAEQEGPYTDSQGVRFDYQEGQAYDSHHLGAVVGSTFWALRAQNKGIIDDAQWGNIVLKTLVDIQNPGPDFRLADFFNALHKNLPRAVQDDACALFETRLLVIQDELLCTP